MSRIINPESAAKERIRLTRAIVLALRELMRQQDLSENSRDLAAFIGLALQELYSTIDTSVAAWEKRGYWVKADRFRMEWEWSGRFARQLQKALIDQDWATVPLTVIQVAQKFENVKPPSRNVNGKFWAGSFSRLNSTTL